jgi:phospholipid/cholesterol/gamma-HCH transport system substrate-binding protein
MESETNPPKDAAPVAHLDLKARLLVSLVALLVAAAIVFVLYARGAFERTQTLVLIANHAEGVVVGMDLSFAGFPVGRVRRIGLGEDGNARIIIDVPVKDARWLRISSVFTMESGLVGGPRLRAYSGMLQDPPLPDGAERRLHSGDAAAEIPRLMASMRELLSNLGAMTADGAPLNAGLRNLQQASERLKGPQGALGVLMGDEAAKLITTLERSNALLARLDGLAALAKDLLVGAGDQAVGSRGLVSDGKATMQQLNGLLGDARASLKRADALLIDAQAIAGNTRAATADLGTLRAEVEASLRQIEHLVKEVNRRWPFARETEIKLP